MEWRLLTHDRELEIFQVFAKKLWGVKYPLDYLRRGHTYGCMTSSGEMIGGIALVFDTKLRTLSFFSDEDRKKLPVLSSTPDSAFCEITGFWFDPSCSDPRLSGSAWLQLLKSLRATGKTQVIWGYNLEHEGLTRLYSQLGTTTLFEGDVSSESTPDGNQASRGAIVTVSLPRAHIFIWKMLVKRMMRRRVRGVYWLHGKSSAS